MLIKASGPFDILIAARVEMEPELQHGSAHDDMHEPMQSMEHAVDGMMHPYSATTITPTGISTSGLDGSAVSASAPAVEAHEQHQWSEEMQHHDKQQAHAVLYFDIWRKRLASSAHNHSSESNANKAASNRG